MIDTTDIQKLHIQYIAASTYLCVVNLHWVPPPWNSENWSIIKEPRKFVRVESCTGDEQLKVRSKPGYVLD